MSSEQKNDLAKILKRYLSHVIYIDDEFKVSWKMETTEEIRRPSRSSRVTGQSHPAQSEEESSEGKDNLVNFCEQVQKQYPEILLTPIPYVPSIKREQLLAHMKNARMLILDWNLTDDERKKTTAVELLQEVRFQDQLRFCVIYTSRLDEAKADFLKKMPHVREQGTQKDTYKQREYEYVRADSVFYMLCEKDKFDPGMIIGALTDVFIKEVGYFPIAFIDMITRLEDKVPYYLNKFSYPFDKLLLLQTSDDGLPLDDVYHTISDMVFNNLRADIELDESVLKNIYEQQIKVLKELVQNETEFQKKLKQTMEFVTERLGCGEEDKEIFLKIPESKYKEIVEKAISQPYDLSKSIARACDRLVKLYGNYKAEEVLRKNAVSGTDIGNLKKELSRVYKERYAKKIGVIFPACLVILTNPEQSYNINSLITSLKTVAYDEDNRYFSRIFEGCYKEVDDYMCLQEHKDGSSGLSLLQNKLKPGDILLRSDEGKECYLCIVPSCHLLRPKKVEGNILFIKGEIVDQRPDRMLRDSEHFTILPGIEDENIPIRVIWKYHRMMELDLNKIHRKIFEVYYRPYRLSYEYIRQIVGEFVAFYSKSGVERLFLESDVSLEHLLITDKEVGNSNE